MYDKAGLVLRVETVINNPGEFKVRKKHGKRIYPLLSQQVPPNTMT
jgi:hypothetical protein